MSVDDTGVTRKLAGFGGELEVLTPPSVRHRLVEIARHILQRYEYPRLS